MISPFHPKRTLVVIKNVGQRLIAAHSGEKHGAPTGRHDNHQMYHQQGNTKASHQFLRVLSVSQVDGAMSILSVASAECPALPG
jgi:hypothetical protein